MREPGPGARASRAERDPQRSFRPLPALALFASTFACFAPVLWNGFIDQDDPENIVGNEHLAPLSLANLAWMASEYHMGHWQPLTWLSLGLDRALFGPGPAGFHLTSVLLHALNAVLVWRLILRLLPSLPQARFAAALGALCFALHPLRVESVAWATQRRDVLSATLLLAALLCYRRRPALCLLAFGLALLAKAGGMTLPLVLLVIDACVLGRSLRDWRPWLEKIPFVLLAAFAARQAYAAQVAAGAWVSYAAIPLDDRLLQACHGLWFYVAKTLWPFDIAAVYDRPAQLALAEPRIAFAVAFVLGAAALLCVRRRAWPALAAGALWYALLLAPVLGLAQSGPQLVAARYSYLACLPFAVAVAALAARIRFARGLAIAALLLLAGLTVRQCLLWRDTGTLFTHALTIEPGSGTAHFFAGCARERAGDFAAAEAHYRSAVAWWPQDVAALTNLGSVRARQGDWREAILWWQRALYARPEAARDARLNLEDARRAHPELFPPR